MKAKEVLDPSMFLVDVKDESDGSSRRTLSFSRAPTVLLTFAANRFTRSSARDYLDRFGIGAMDWRMLVMLTREPGCDVARASTAIGIDKGAVSRSLARLQKSGLATFVSRETDERRKTWRLTPKGEKLHDDILEVALQRLEATLDGFSKKDVSELSRLLAKLIENLDKQSG